jgi:hypothetical protein
MSLRFAEAYSLLVFEVKGPKDLCCLAFSDLVFVWDFEVVPIKSIGLF